ncbi:MAG: NAD(P)/FAD-dependent oxidoreductase [Nitrososphaerota archaeon]
MRRIVVLGGGFGGVAAVQRLDRMFRHDADVEITLISNTNYLVYTPMLADVAGGTIEPRHAVPALRGFLKKARLRQATVDGIDVARHTVQGTLINGEHAETSYDYLVIALGAVTNFGHATGAAEHALGLKDLLDAFLVHNRALTMLELANTTRDPQRRRDLLTFVMAGGGFSGVEGIAALEDLIHGALRYYPDITRDDIRFILAPLETRLLSEVDERLGAYVVEQFRHRGIDVRLGVGVTAVSERSATLTTGEVIPTHTVIWAGGTKVNPVVQRFDLPRNTAGALLVNRRLQVVDHPAVFALGDCAAVPLPEGQGFYTPTAQNAIRQGAVAAENIAALIRGSTGLKTFRFRPMGSLASLGQRQAIAEIGNVRFSGLPAWLAWRAIYLAKMPTVANKVRVGLDWLKELITPVDTVQIPIHGENVRAGLRPVSRGEDR